MADVGIVEARSIQKVLLEKAGWDFSDYSITFFKRRLEYMIASQGYQNVDILRRKLEQEEGALDTFLTHFLPSTTEMFRDPSLWRYLKETVLPEFRNGASAYKIWVASFNSAEELYSLAIVLREMHLLERVKIYACCHSEEQAARFREGLFDSAKMGVSEANYNRYNGKISFSSYFKASSDGTLRLLPELLRNVELVQQTANFDNLVTGCRLILFRNQMLYMNISLEERVISKMRECLVAGGLLAVGIKENLEHLSGGSNFTSANSAEKVYKRKIS